MLDSGLSTNLVSPSFLEKLGLEAEAEPMEGTAPGGRKGGATEGPFGSSRSTAVLKHGEWTGSFQGDSK